MLWNFKFHRDSEISIAQKFTYLTMRYGSAMEALWNFFIYFSIAFAIVSMENRYLYGKKILLWTLWKNNIAMDAMETGRHFLIGADPIMSFNGTVFFNIYLFF